MQKEYYEEMGCNLETGMPSKKKLQELELDKYVKIFNIDLEKK